MKTPDRYTCDAPGRREWLTCSKMGDSKSQGPRTKALVLDGLGLNVRSHTPQLCVAWIHDLAYLCHSYFLHK